MPSARSVCSAAAVRFRTSVIRHDADAGFDRVVERPFRRSTAPLGGSLRAVRIPWREIWTGRVPNWWLASGMPTLAMFGTGFILRITFDSVAPSWMMW